MPQFWSRNTWTWVPGRPKPTMVLEAGRVRATHPALARVRICEVDAPGVEWLFCENETNFNRLYGAKMPGPFKDGINDFVVNGDRKAVNPLRTRHEMRRPSARGHSGRRLDDVAAAAAARGDG